MQITDLCSASVEAVENAESRISIVPYGKTGDYEFQETIGTKEIGKTFEKNEKRC